MRDSNAGRTHSYGDGCQPPHADPDWGPPASDFLALGDDQGLARLLTAAREQDAMRVEAQRCREEARQFRHRLRDDDKARYEWTSTSSGDHLPWHLLTREQRDALRLTVTHNLEKAAAIERQLRDLPHTDERK